MTKPAANSTRLKQGSIVCGRITFDLTVSSRHVNVGQPARRVVIVDHHPHLTARLRGKFRHRAHRSGEGQLTVYAHGQRNARARIGYSFVTPVG
jgi:hypothetical protein